MMPGHLRKKLLQVSIDCSVSLLAAKARRETLQGSSLAETACFASEREFFQGQHN